ncbi:MAG TPA: OmpH family outer membrane protein [Verrucomicrobiae bacterium]|nr:OmpH family outer membrane protein [Verrucomicrobiae bacterium]
MKTMTLRLFWLALLLGGVVAHAAAATDVKIATVDLKKVFDSYYKTKLADANIKDEANGLEKDLRALMEDHDKALTEYKKAIEESSNQALSAEEREKRKKDAEGKLIKVNDLRQTVEQFKRTADNNLEEKSRLTREKIYGDIRNVVNTLAKKMGYTMVLDTSTGIGRMPVVVFHNGETDVTNAVIEQLNANAPADLPIADDKKDKDKEKSGKSGKNEKDNKK